jgi:light-regulated signal transduction histidine kinase (bacteriophytochrome)
MMRFDTALNNMIQGLCMFDSQQRLIVCNERYLELYGFSPDVVKPGIMIREIMEYSVALGNYNPEEAERAVAERPIHAARRDQATLLQRLRDGRIIAVMHQPMSAGGSVATYEDVTERLRAEEAMRAYATKLEQSNRELQSFASIASHDLQEPLRKIEAFGDRLTAKYADRLEDNGRMYVERMQSAAGRMRTLINDLLSYSRVTSKAAPFRSVDLKQIAEDVASDLQITIEEVTGRLEVGDLPVLDADPTQMRQLLQNLISNALKFKKTDVAPIVAISATVVRPPQPDFDFECGPSGLCEIRVADNGIGFDMKYSERIFGIFQRLHGRNEYEGTGIGLATCRKIAERHHGTIRAESAVGEGTRFIIELPVRQAATAE